MRNKLLNSVVAGLLSIALANIALAWGPTTHVVVTNDVMSKLSGPMMKDDELKNIILSTSRGPDFSELGEAYHIWHDPDFVVALRTVASKLEGRERDKLYAASYGWNSHIQGDSVGHSWEGYPNAKKIFQNLPKDRYLPSHLSTEFSVGLLDYNQNKKLMENLPFYMPPTDQFMAALEEYKKIKTDKGDTQKASFQYSAEQYEKDVAKFKTTSDRELATYQYITANQPQVVKQLEKKFKDRAKGVGGKGGIEQTVEAVREGFFSLDKDGTPTPKSASWYEKSQAAVEGVGESISGTVDSNVEWLKINSAAGVPAVRKIVDSMINERNPDEAVFLKYVKGLMIEKDLSVDEIISNVQKDIPPESNDYWRYSDAKNQVRILQKKISGLQERISKRSIVGKISSFFFGDGDKDELEAAKKALAGKMEMVGELEAKLMLKTTPSDPSTNLQKENIKIDKISDY